ANLVTGNTATSFVAPGVPNGTYFVRVHALGSGGQTSGPSNETRVDVGGTAPPPPPTTPGGVTIVLHSASISPSAVLPGATAQLTVFLTAAAPAGGAVVTLS